MESIKQYGDLTEKELFDFIDEIENDDDDINEAQSEALKKISLEEEQTELSWIDTGKNIILCGPESQRKANMAGIKVIKQRSQHLKEDRLRIQRKAFNQEFISLSSLIGNENIKLLISLLVKEHTRMIDKYTAYINKRLAALLRPFIPRRLRMCKSLYPDSIKICPGFLYKASIEYGAGLTFWAMPDIPYYFTQNTEQKILIEHKSPFLINVDQSIKLRHEHAIKRADKELKYASLIFRKKVCSYFDLLKLNPFWYETLYNYLKNKENGK